MTATRTLAALVSVALVASACASSSAAALKRSPALKGYAAEIAACEEAAGPGFGGYAKAAGVGFATRVLTPFRFLGEVFAPRDEGSTAPPPATGDARVMVAIVAGLATAAGIVAGPFLAFTAASDSVRDARQAAFDRCLAARGVPQPPTTATPRVLVVRDGEPDTTPVVATFIEALRRHGHVVDETLRLDVRRVDEIDLAALVAGGWDVVVLCAPLADDAQPTRIGIPTVVAVEAIGPVHNDVALRMLLRAVPDVRHLAVVANVNNARHREWLSTLATAISDVKISTASVIGDEDLEATLEAAVAGGAQALLVWPDPALDRRRHVIVSLARRHRLPAMAADAAFAEGGGLFAYEIDRAATARRAADAVDRILKGMRPERRADALPASLQFTVNLTTAEDLGLVLATPVILRADRVVR